MKSPEKIEEIRAAQPRDLEPVTRLLGRADLPTAEVERWFSHYYVAESEGEIVGVAGLEVHGLDGVLRSVVVAEPWRGLGLGDRLVSTVLEHARAREIDRLWLLTTTADEYFTRHGFRRIPRDEAPDRIRASVEFSEACPASAVAMVLTVETGARGGAE